MGGIRLARRLAAVKPSPTFAAEQKARALRAQGVDVVSLTVGEPDFDTPRAIKQAAVRAIEEGFTKYTPTAGTPELREAICAKLARDNGLAYRPEQVIASAGAKQAIYNLLMVLLDPDDEVLIPAPYWVSYPDMVELAGGRPVIVETSEAEGFKLTPARLARAITPRSRLLILNTPCNPTGAAYTREELAALARVCVEHDLLVCSDEIYEKLVYDGFVHTSFAALGPEVYARTITVNGLSKAFAMTGWRLGYAAGPVELVQAMEAVQSQSTSNPCSITLKAATYALTGPADELPAMVAEFDRRRRFLVDALGSLPGVSCATPTGAFYAWPNVSRLLGRRTPEGRRLATSYDLVDYLLEAARVATVAGAAFGVEGYLRLSYATALPRLEEAIARMRGALARLA
ncbi:MAG TPA: pyridoxal phosphate-dependent aminotransferase [Thermodesulfobacteriota bacterium]|nr:pyridoxal phosphate-dependent aminotransferase [Thermodesulfobacteriota bacterium]